MGLEEFDIAELVPGDDPRPGVLNYYKTLWLKEGSLASVYKREAPNVTMHYDGDQMFLTNGNQRAIFYMINGICRIQALLFKVEYDEDWYAAKCVAESFSRRGIHSFEDLIAQIENPEQYMVTGR